jgi:hypothetical protein
MIHLAIVCFHSEFFRSAGEEQRVEAYHWPTMVATGKSDRLLDIGIGLVDNGSPTDFA